MDKNNIIDLHIHTCNSDGELLTREIVRRLHDKRISTFSITDHDYIYSYKDVNNLAHYDFDINDLNYIKGVELSCKVSDTYNIHLLGYDFDENNQSLIKLTNEISFKREKRLREILNILKNEHNIWFNNYALDEIRFRKGTHSKCHALFLLRNLGYGDNGKELYNQYLRDIKFTIDHRASFEAANAAVKDAHGITVLAHPKEVENEYQMDIEPLIKNLVDRGLMGIEVYNNIHSLADIKRYLEIAKKYNLLISGGSDYHGPFITPQVTLGCVSKEGINIDNLSVVEYIKRRH